MSNYKKIMFDKGIMQKEVLDKVRHTDPRVDKSLLSKIVNDVCLPTPQTLDGICRSLSCDVYELYDPREITLAPKGASVSSGARKSRERRARNDFYNLTVEIPRDIAERVFAKASLRKLGYLSKTDCIRQFVKQLDRQLTEMSNKEKAADGADAPNDGKQL